MKITKEQVQHVANLARLNLTEEEQVELTTDLENIIAFADKLNELNIEHIKPTAHVIPIENVFRKDEVRPSLEREDLLSNAPDKQEGCFYVPKIVE
ncbi:Asp-tRNA(Asn)/Glu-tRNA(Gln) amidotransferase subunit GatC [Vallitalea okinawensis]|uniref:Asp-tRNA(Asn)/Glu-tRNA(Gln) amidotransferase subunit GatC n=1 Tax=Vallitalea okinawensis TaxID=2078660 RepID=UPI000CFACCDC|nr:Asp-tRNA(Asn)/Glu-tRNA(Gln) amidotransferase subunit GatC [Vallitalea okinawensis]